MKGIQDTTTQSYGNLIGNNNKFEVPAFQRDYSWDEEQWDDLWQDINTMVQEGEDHYMGYLVLQLTGDNQSQRKIIDGQQRFTTITLIILALIKAIKTLAEKGEDTESNKARVEDLMIKYIGRRDPISLEYDNILRLNRNNNSFYKDYIVKLGSLRTRELSTSDKLMKKCFEWYESKVNVMALSGKEYAEFILKVVENLYFTVIFVNDDLNAFKVFETLNARGVQLSSSDLLKNYLFSLVNDNDENSKRLKDLEYKWNSLAHNVRQDKLPDFVRYYWNSKNKIVRSSELFKAIRKNITTATQVFELVNDMISYSDVYMALKNANDELWDDDKYGKDIHENIRMLIQFNLKQPYSLLMAAYHNLLLSEFSKLLDYIIVISFRYNIICSKNPNDIEKVYNNCAVSISTSKVVDYSQLKSIYIDDKEFSNSFSLKVFVYNSRNVKTIRYILGKIEQQKSSMALIDIDDDKNSIEHIMPQNPNKDWEVDEFRIEQLSSRLGNMCLLNNKDNRNIGNMGYDEKKEVYANSKFITTKSIPEHYSQWSENEINSRQRNMAKIATSIWRIDF